MELLEPRPILHTQEVIILALDDQGSAIGFTPIYPSFSPGLVRRIFILNDPFINPTPVAVESAAVFCGQRLSLGLTRLRRVCIYRQSSTTLPLRRYTSRFGWRRDNVFCTYTLPLRQTGI